MIKKKDEFKSQFSRTAAKKNIPGRADIEGHADGLKIVSVMTGAVGATASFLIADIVMGGAVTLISGSFFLFGEMKERSDKKDLKNKTATIQTAAHQKITGTTEQAAVYALAQSEVFRLNGLLDKNPDRKDALKAEIEKTKSEASKLLQGVTVLENPDGYDSETSVVFLDKPENAPLPKPKTFKL